MNLNRIIHENRGLGLLEVMIAAGLLGVVSLGVMQITKQMNKSSKSSGQKLEFQMATSAIASILRDEYSCEATLKGLTPTGTGSKVNSIIRKKVTGGELEVYSIGDTIGSVGQKVFLKDMIVKNYNDEKGIGELVLVMNKGSKDYDKMNEQEKKVIRNTSFGAPIVNLSIPLNMLLDDGGKIKDCVSDKDLYTTGACGILNGNFEDKVKCKSIDISAAQNMPAIISRGDLSSTTAIKFGEDPEKPRVLLKHTVNPDEVQLQGTNDSNVGTLILGNSDKILGGNNTLKFITPSSEVSGKLIVQEEAEFKKEVKIGDSGQSIIKYNGVDLEISGSKVIIKTPEQSKYAGISGGDNEMVATRGWVKALVTELLKGEANALGDIAAALVQYSQSQQLDVLKRNICESTEGHSWVNGTCKFVKTDACGGESISDGYVSGKRSCKNDLANKITSVENELAQLKADLKKQEWIAKNCAGTVGSVCKVNGTSCPSGSSRVGSWSETRSVTCYGGSTTGCNSGPSCNTGSHAFSNTGVESCRPPRYAACGPATQGYGSTCYAQTTMVGCSIPSF